MLLADPKSIKVNVSSGSGVDIDWKDGHQTHYTFQFLRDACPCATCEEERKADNREPGVQVKPAATLLPMYKPPVRPTSATPVGKYAIHFKWNDGHESGIYSWDYLRAQCRCSECQAKISTDTIQ